MKRKFSYISYIVLFLTITLTGCGGNKATTFSSATALSSSTPQNYEEKIENYLLQPGDNLDIKFFYNPELNESIIIRPDGRISLPLVDEIVAAGLTPAELTNVLKEKYAVEVKQPKLTVMVRSFSMQQIFVDGEVNRAGIFNLTGPMTVLKSISLAEGLRDTAKTEQVIVIRRGVDKKPIGILVNLKSIIEGTDMSQDISLKPFDIVYVPKSSIANVNVWIDQYIRRNIPFQPGFGIAP